MAANATMPANPVILQAFSGEIMSLVPCRACGHTVDTSAEACPGCGATNPGKKMSRQRRDLIIMLVEIVLGVTLLVAGGAAAWSVIGPIIKTQQTRPVHG